MSPDYFIQACAPFASVSHETFVNLKSYADLLVKWQSKINLVSNSTIDDLWQRHIYDSAQLLSYIRTDDRVVDFGSGAGFPPLVLSIMGIGNVTAIESDQRKVAFMQEVARTAKAPIKIINQRIEKVEPFPVDVISARAFASLDDILTYAAPWWKNSTRAVLLKGKNVKEELTAASSKWHIDFQSKPSLADPDGSVLLIERIEARI